MTPGSNGPSPEPAASSYRTAGQGSSAVVSGEVPSSTRTTTRGACSSMASSSPGAREGVVTTAATSQSDATTASRFSGALGSRGT